MIRLLQQDSSTGGIFGKPPVVRSSGTTSAGQAVGLDSDGKLDLSVLPSGVGARVRVLEADGALSANDLVNIFLDTTEQTPKWKVRRAVATDRLHYCNGFVKTAYEDGTDATVYLDGTFEVSTEVLGTLSDLTLFLSAASPGKPGPYNSTAPIFQVVGYLIDNGVAEFQITPAIAQFS
jgi:hypothetical protein